MRWGGGDGRWKATPRESVGGFAAGGEAGRRSPGPRTGARGPGAVGELPSAADTEGFEKKGTSEKNINN